MEMEENRDTKLRRTCGKDYGSDRDGHINRSFENNSIQEATEKWDPIYNWICSIT